MKVVKIDPIPHPNPKGGLNSFWFVYFDGEFQDGKQRCLSVGPTRRDLKEADAVKNLAAQLVQSGEWDPQAEPVHDVPDIMPVIELPRQRI